MTLKEIFLKHGQPLSTAPRDGAVFQMLHMGFPESPVYAKIDNGELLYFSDHFPGWVSLSKIKPGEVLWLPVYADQNSKEGK